MNQDLFQVKNEAFWIEFDHTLTLLEKRKTGEDVKDFPQQYRRMCKQLALANDRRYSAYMVDRLNNLVLRGHNILYKARSSSIQRLFRFFMVTFPSAVRKEARLFWLCSLLFYGPFFGMIILIYFNPDMVFSVQSPETVYRYESMYDPAQKVERTGDIDFNMFGFYIWNNVSIDFRTFASGLIAGIGSIFFLIYNGLTLGSTFGHFLHVPYKETFYTFVAGHGAFELTALVLAGVAGFRLGFSWVIPGNLSRRESLRRAGRTAFTIIFGTAVMTILAAFIEAFWSPRDLSASLKYAVGVFFWVLTAFYFLFAGRGHES